MSRFFNGQNSAVEAAGVSRAKDCTWLLDCTSQGYHRRQQRHAFNEEFVFEAVHFLLSHGGCFFQFSLTLRKSAKMAHLILALDVMSCPRAGETSERQM